MAAEDTEPQGGRGFSSSPTGPTVLSPPTAGSPRPRRSKLVETLRYFLDVPNKETEAQEICPAQGQVTFSPFPSAGGLSEVIG